MGCCVSRVPVNEDEDLSVYRTGAQSSASPHRESKSLHHPARLLALQTNPGAPTAGSARRPSSSGDGLNHDESPNSPSFASPTALAAAATRLSGVEPFPRKWSNTSSTRQGSPHQTRTPLPDISANNSRRSTREQRGSANSFAAFSMATGSSNPSSRVGSITADINTSVSYSPPPPNGIPGHGITHFHNPGKDFGRHHRSSSSKDLSHLSDGRRHSPRSQHSSQQGNATAVPKLSPPRRRDERHTAATNDEDDRDLVMPFEGSGGDASNETNPLLLERAIPSLSLTSDGGSQKSATA